MCVDAGIFSIHIHLSCVKTISLYWVGGGDEREVGEQRGRRILGRKKMGESLWSVINCGK